MICFIFTTMIKAEKHTFIDPVPGADPIADSDIVHAKNLIITITHDDENYQLFEVLLKALNITIEEKIKSE